MRYPVLIFLFLISFIYAGAQEEVESKNEALPSPDTASIFYTNLNDRWPGEKLFRLADSTLTGYQYFLPTEGETALNALAGNAGLAYKSMVFTMPEYSGFKYTPFEFLAYKWINRNIRYFQTTAPYSRLFYSTGPEREQLFNVTHSQNIAGGLTMGLDVMIVNSRGLYERQKSDNVSFAGTAQFVNKKEYYVVLGNYHNSRFKWQENGGLSNRGKNLFETNEETDRKRIPVNLAVADNVIKEAGFQARQFLYFGKRTTKPVTDSLKSDTIGPKKLHRYYDPYRSNFIRHTLSYSKGVNQYTDTKPLSGFYNMVYLDSVKTNDSLYYYEVKNDISVEAGVGRAKGSTKAILLRIGIEHSAAAYKNDTISKRFNIVTQYAFLSANAFGYAKAEGKVWNTIGTPFNGDKGISGSLLLPGYDNSEKWGNLKISAELAIEQPFYFYQYHYSNHFMWDKSFGQQTTISFKAAYDYKFFKAGFNLYNINEYVYLDKSATPVKEENPVTISQIWAYTDLRWRGIESQIYGVIQNSSQTNAVSLPSFAGRMTLYYTRPLFKKALHFQAGAAALYNTPYYADGYMPAIRAFYVQNRTKTGGYPYLDAFINIRVKRAKMYLMMKHFNSGMLDYEYYMIPGYPMPDRGLRFGIAWAFYD